MPLGESIGDAYVRVHANGEDVRVGINDSFDGLEGDLNRRGQEGGEAYRQGWMREMDRFSEDLRHSLNPAFTDLSRGLERNRVMLTGADSRVERLRGSLSELAEQTERNLQHMDDFNDALRSNSNAMDGLRSRLQGTSHALNDLDSNLRRGVNSTRELGDETDRLGDSTDRTGRRFGFLRDRVDSFSNIIRAGTLNKPALITTLQRMGDEGDRNNRIFGRLNNHVNNFSDIVGRGFGRGSRNNFLNFMGSMARGFVRLIGIIPKAIDLVTTFTGELLKKMTKAAADAGGGIEGFLAAMVALGEEMIAFAPIAIGFVAVLGAMVLVIGPLISLFSGLAAAITAVAASLAFAVVGALAPLVGLIAPLGIGVGVLVAAFVGLDKAAKKALKEAVKPLKEELGKLGDIARKPILDAITDNAKKLVPLFQNLRPLVRNVSEAFGGLIDDFGKAADNKGSGLNKFIDRMTKFAPNAIDKLGESLGNFLSGMLGVFRALTGPVNRFLGWLQEITDEFDNWANSVKGQKEMKKFFDDASDSASALWGLLGAIKDILVTLFDSGKGTGDNIITTMTDKLQEFNQFLKDNPHALEDWFTFGQDTVDQLGDIAVSLGEIADALDDERSRSDLLTTLSAIGEAVTFIDNTIEAVQILIDLLTGNTNSGFLSGLNEDAVNLGNTIRDKVVGAVKAIGDAFSDIGDSFERLGGGNVLSVGMFTGWIPGAATAIQGFVNQVGGWFSDLPGRIAGFFSGLAGRILKAIGNVHLFDAIDFPSFGSITSHFGGLGKAILHALGHVHLFDNFDFPGFGSITSHFVGLGKAILRALGHIHLFDNFDFPSFSSITSHFVGLGKAILKALGSIHLFDAIDFPSWDSITSHFSGLGAAIVRAIGSIDIFPTIHMPSLPHISLGGGSPNGGDPNIPGPRIVAGLGGGTGIPMSSTGTTNSRTINNEWHITTPNTDARAAAVELLNHMVATAY